MAMVRRVGPASAFKVAMVLYAILGLVLGIFVAFLSTIAGSLGGLAPTSNMPGGRLFGAGMGFGAIIFFPVLYGVFGGVFAAIGAVIYNLVAGLVGGLEVELE
jgi:hypothetical protein